MSLHYVGPAGAAQCVHHLNEQDLDNECGTGSKPSNKRKGIDTKSDRCYFRENVALLLGRVAEYPRFEGDRGSFKLCEEVNILD